MSTNHLVQPSTDHRSAKENAMTRYESILTTTQAKDKIMQMSGNAMVRMLAAVVGAVVVLGATAHSAMIIKPTGVTATNTDGKNPNAYQSPNRMIDGSGLSATLVTGDAAPVAWPTHTINQPDLWVAAQALNGWLVTFTLGSLPAPGLFLTGFHLWNENEVFPRDALNYTVEYSVDNGSSYLPISATPSPLLPAPGLSTYTGDSYGFGTSPANPTHVRFSLAFNSANDGYIGFSEIRFLGEPVPEPTSLALLALSGLALLKRRR